MVITRPTDAGGSDEVGVDSLYTDGDPNPCYNARVIVDGVEIPTVDTSQHDEPAIRTEIRTDGPASVTRISDVYVPAFWNGENVFESLPLNDDSEITVPVQIETRPPQSSVYDSEWQTIHYGWLRKIGSGGDGRLLRFKIGDYANIVNNTPITQTWKKASYETMLEWGISRLNEKGGFPEISLASDVSGSLLPWYRAPSSIEGGQAKEKSFTATEGDTVSTLFNWIAERVGSGDSPSDWWIEPTENGNLALLFTELSNVSDQWTARNSGGDLYVRDNRALYSIDPINTVTVIGKQTNIAGGGEDEAYYIVARAEHEALLKNANGQSNGNVVRGEFSDVEKAENAAVKRLAEAIRTGGEGDIIVGGNPKLFLTDRVTSKPLCGEYVSDTVPEVTYSVKKVTHNAPASGRLNTKLSVGMYADESEISVTGGYGTKKGDIEILSSDVDSSDDSDDGNTNTLPHGYY